MVGVVGGVRIVWLVAVVVRAMLVVSHYHEPVPIPVRTVELIRIAVQVVMMAPYTAANTTATISATVLQ